MKRPLAPLLALLLAPAASAQITPPLGPGLPAHLGHFGPPQVPHPRPRRRRKKQTRAPVRKARSVASRAVPHPEIPQPEPHTDLTRAKSVLLSFDKQDLIEVVKAVSEWTGRNFILQDNVHGRITILSQTPVTPDQAYQAFLAALDVNNFSVYPVGRFLKIVPKSDAVRANIPTLLDPNQQYPEDERMVTKLFRLKYTQADPMRGILQNFISRNGQIEPYPPDVLIISDNALNMHRIGRLIGQLDQASGSDVIRIVPVTYASAKDLAEKLTQVFQSQGGPQNGAPRPIGFVPAYSRPGQPAAGGEAAPVSVQKIIADERTNKLIIIAGPKGFERVEELIHQLDTPATGEGQVHVYYLENAKAQDVAQTLQSLANGGGGPQKPGGAASLFSGQVKITADKDTNSLVIVASPADYSSVVEVIRRLDIHRKQVFVEAVIMEVNVNDENQYQVSAHTGGALSNVNFHGANGPAPLVLGSEPGSPGQSLSLASLLGMSGFLAGLQGPPITGLPISLPSFGVLLQALETDSNVNVISTPHILTSDNQEAEITVGENVPFPAGYSPSLPSSLLSTATATGATGTPGLSGFPGINPLGFGLGSLYAPIQRQNVELKLKIKPQINESDYVRLEIDEQTEEIAGNNPQLGPTTAKRTIKTTVVAKDQQTIVIGGLIQDKTTHSVNKIPILGSIPVIGWLFRQSDDRKEKTNLLLFLTPYIIRDQADFRQIFERKLKEREEFVREFYGESGEYQVPIDFDRKEGPLGAMYDKVNAELQKVENGGPGSPGERIISPHGDTGSPGPAAPPKAAPATPSAQAAPAPSPAD